MISKVTSNVKGGVNTTLGQRTLVVGRNATGKSAIVQSVELATTGAASDVAGRALVKAGADLFQTLTPPGAEVLWAEVVMDRAAARFEVRDGSAGKRVGPEVYFPLRDVRAALLGSAETARKALLSWAGAGGDWRERVVAALPPALHARLHAVAGPDLASTLDGAKAKGRAAAAKAGALEEQAKRGGQGLPVPPEPVALKAMEMRVEKARQAVAAQGFEEMRKVRLSLALAQEQAKRRLGEAKAASTAAEVALAQRPATVDIPEVYRMAIAVIDHVVEAGLSGCPLCGTGVSTEVFKIRAQAGHAKLDEAAKAADARRAAEAAAQDAAADYATAKVDVQRVEAEMARIDAALANAPAMPDIVPEQSVADLEAEFFAAQRAAVAWTSVRRAQAEALEAEREAREWKDLAEGLSVHLGTEVERARSAFEAKVQRFLPWAFGIDLLDGEREVLRVGLRGADGKVKAALSGAEWAAVTAAIALAVAGDRECMVVPEERAFDPFTLATVLETFGKALPEGVQILVTSPVEPSHVPEGWVVVKTGAADPWAMPTAGTAAPAPEVEPTPAAAPPVEKKGKGKKKGPMEKAEAAPAAEPVASPPVTSPSGNVCPHGCGEVVLGKCDHGYGPGKPAATAPGIFD